MKQKRQYLPLVLLLCTLLCCACSPVSFFLASREIPSPDAHPYPPADTLEEGETLSENLPVPEPEEEHRVSFLGAGDSIVHTGSWMEAEKKAKELGNGRNYDFTHIFTDVRDTIAAADLAFINQETLMAGEAFALSSYPRFNSPQELGEDLVSVGFDLVNIATNHMADKMEAGLRSTIDFWHTQPVTLLGGFYDRTDFDNIRVVEKNGIRIAWLAYCYGTNGLSLPASSELVIPYLNEEDVRRQTALARDLADFTAVSVHWGDDSVQNVTDYQKSYAQLFADCGVDVVVGHHPHLIQPIEWLEGKDGNKMLCAYSLGNLYGLMMSPYNMVGGFFCFDFVKKGDDTHIDNVHFLPTVFYYQTDFFGQHLYFMEDYTEELAVTHGTQVYKAGNYATAAELRRYVNRIMDPALLPESLRQSEDAA